uniref:hypothetical protein n=1 Tax=Acinetobacter baumannii TaxID=470 RepID=UPI00339307E6
LKTMKISARSQLSAFLSMAGHVSREYSRLSVTAFLKTTGYNQNLKTVSRKRKKSVAIKRRTEKRTQAQIQKEVKQLN